VAHHGEETGDLAAGAFKRKRTRCGEARGLSGFGLLGNTLAAGMGGGGLGGAEHEHEGDRCGAEANAGTGEGTDDVADDHRERYGEGEMAEGEGCVQAAVKGNVAEFNMASVFAEVSDESRDLDLGASEYFPPDQ
jgi:hypothetical protein